MIRGVIRVLYDRGSLPAIIGALKLVLVHLTIVLKTLNAVGVKTSL